MYKLMREKLGRYKININKTLRKEITECELLEKKLLESEEKYRKLIEIANDAIFVVDVETGYIFDINKHAEVLLGLPSEEIIGTHYTKIHPVEEVKCCKKLFEKYAKIDKSITSEDIYVQHKDGRKIPVEISTSVFRLGDRKVIQGIFRDITERKRSEDHLRKLSCAVEQSPTTVIITDTKGSIEYVNPKFSQLTGYTFKEAIGQNPSILKSGKTPPKEYKQLWETITAGREWQGKFCNKKKNGEVYWESVSISPIRNTEGIITHFVGIKEDITRHKKTEELLKAQNKDLEHKNIALSEVLGQIENEKKQIKNNVIANVENLLLPIVQKLILKKESYDYVQLLRKNLQELTSSFGIKLNNKRTKLTSREIEICNMVKNGFSSKEITNLLNISLRTTEKHRATVRKKLCINNKDRNLGSFLRTL